LSNGQQVLIQEHDVFHAASTIRRRYDQVLSSVLRKYSFPIRLL
jgi:hypothetical protein